jgi:hypothetical protein
MPVLAIGGEFSFGSMMATVMRERQRPESVVEVDMA